MKTRIDRSALLRVLGHAQSVVERRNTIPVLSNVLLTAEDGTLTVTATDLDIQVRETVPADVTKPGRTTVSAHTFHDIVRKMPDGCEIELAVTDLTMRITGGRARFNLPLIEADQFPELKPGDLPTTFAIPAETFAAMLDRTRFAMSTEETRYYLNGIFLHVGEDGAGNARLKAVSTDGHRLSLVSTPLPDGIDAIPQVIIPRKCVQELVRVIGDLDGDIEISLSSTKIRFGLGSLVYVSKVIDGTFPDYARVIPTTNDRLVRVTANELAQGIDRVATIATERTRAVKVGFSRDRITLSVNSPEHGLATEEVEAEYSGPDFEIGFNARYFLDALALMRGETVELSMKTAADPAVLRKQGEEADLVVLMPMRI